MALRIDTQPRSLLLSGRPEVGTSGGAVTPPARSESGFSPSASAARKALETRFAERILDNEALRGDLTDSEFMPIQDRAFEQLREAAARVVFPGTPLGELQMERAYRRIVSELKDAVQATSG